MVSANILMVSSILFQDICKNRESGSTFSGGVGLCREREVAGRNSVQAQRGDKLRRWGCWGRTSTYLEVLSAGNSREVSTALVFTCDWASGSTSSSGIWLCGEGGGGEEQRGHSVATS